MGAILVNIELAKSPHWLWSQPNWHCTYKTGSKTREFL